ncbi:MAG: AraC family transcriptional regulator [Pseudomonadota bacterium]
MSGQQRRRPYKLENIPLKDVTQGFETKDSYGFLRYLEHGSPNPLVRWHYHEEYELHLILESCGKVFVGDYIGQFEPGHLVLTGPCLPHNWISEHTVEANIALRDMVLQFQHGPLESASQLIPELKDILQLLARAKHGIEFFGISERAKSYLIDIRESEGSARFAEFLKLMVELMACSDYRLLSTLQLQVRDDDPSMASINNIISYITEHCTSQFSMAQLCGQLEMSESQFSRLFRKATGNHFTEFVNRLRINKACQLLMETNLYITDVCYDVGFNNVANFNRRFLEFKGITPKEFRRQAAERFGRH